MVTANDAMMERDQSRQALLEAIGGFYGAPQRLAETQQLIDFNTDQAFDNVTGNFRSAQRQSAFDAARRGIQGGSVETTRQGALQGQFQQAIQGVEANRQAQMSQAQQALEAQRQQALQQAFAPNPFRQAQFGALQQALGGDLEQLQLQGQQAQQLRGIQAQGSQDLAQSIALLPQLFAAQQRMGGV